MNISIKEARVMLCMPVYQQMHGQVASSLLETQAAMIGSSGGGNITLEIGCSIVHAARSKLAHEFLKSDCTHLFWVDSDIVWRAEDFLKMVALGTKMECVAAAYRLKKDEVVYQINGPHTNLTANEYGCLPIHSTGLGFTIVQRKIIEQLAKTSPEMAYPDTKEKVRRIFRFDEKDGVPRGEDIAFFDDIRELGYGVWLNPNVQLGHLGTKQFIGALAEQVTVTETERAA